MNKQFRIALILLATGIGAMAQNEKDAFRYAQYSPTGTARYSALAGSMGAFGSDFSCLSAGNPAGIGLFKRFEFTFTPAVSHNRISTAYNGTKQSGTSTPFIISNLGVVFVGTTDTTAGWKSIQFATGLNNLARYDGLSFVSGGNEGATNYFDYVAKEYASFSDFADNALKYGLIGALRGGGYYSLVNADFNQQQISSTSGYLNEYVFSFGGNYNDKLFLGATLGIPFFKYYEKTTYTESSNPYYDSLIVFNEFSEKASGVNLKLGVIYQPVNYLRLGAAFHTPTWYPNVKERYESSIDVLGVPDTGNKYVDIWLDGDATIFNYSLRTPYHATGSIAFIYKNKGFVNVDYEYVDYTASELQSENYNFSHENGRINSHYAGTHTVRAGGELNLSPLVLRLGYAYSSNPYRREVEKNGSRHTVSGGVGLKWKTFFADFAYMYRFGRDKDVFYDHPSVNPYSVRFVNQVFALTVGWKIKM